MKGFVFPLAELGSGRLTRLCDFLNVKRAEGVGFLMLFWLESRKRGIEEGDALEVASCAPLLGGHDNTGVDGFIGLLDAGYVQEKRISDDETIYVIVDNVGHNAKAARVQAQCKKAAQARLDKAAKPAKAAKKALHPVPTAAPAPLVPVATASQEANRETWAAYAECYQRKMGQPPIRNAKTNSLIKQFVQRLGAQDAPHVIAFFVNHPNPYYMGRLYQLEMAVKDAESLHTQWANNTPITQGDVGHFDTQLSLERDRQRVLNGQF